MIKYLSAKKIDQGRSEIAKPAAALRPSPADGHRDMFRQNAA
jgi:hypothetical protein